MIHTDSHTFKVGSFECILIKDIDHVYKDPAAMMFSNAPREELEQVLRELDIALEEWNTYLSPYPSLLVKTGSHNVLIDTGIGTTYPPTEGLLMQELAAIMVEPEGIDHVLITHAHVDHSGGNADAVGKSLFKRARFIVHKAEWDFWTAEDVLAQPQNEWMKTVVEKNFRPIRSCFELIEDDIEVVPGVSFIFAAGHTPGHMVVRISSDGEQFWYLSDVFLHPAHIVRPDWYAVVDVQPEQAIQTRKSMLKQFSADQSLVHCFHFPFPGLGHIREREDGYRWEPLFAEDFDPD